MAAEMPSPPPPTYNEAVPGEASSKAPQQSGPPPPPAPPPGDDGRWVLSYQDFVPNMLAQGGIFSQRQFEPFSAVVTRANDWLRQNPAVKVKVCESIETKQEHNGINPNAASYYESGNMHTAFVRSLRMWVVPKTAGDNPAPQQFGYLNIVPACISAGAIFTQPQFETYAQTINRLNELFRSQPLPGRILNIETLDVKMESWTGSVDPDQSSWYESGKMSTLFLNVIRVFYEGGPPCHEQIGTIDFVPGQISGGSIGMGAQYEALSSVLQKANQWMQQNPALPVCNVQTLDYKVNNTWGGGTVDTQHSYYFESGKHTTIYVRIVRIYYVTGSSPRQPLQALSYKTFLPAQLSTGSMFSQAYYEGLNQCMTRAMAWLKLTNARVISCETQVVKLHGGLYNTSLAMSSEQTCYFNSGRHAERFVFVFRVFLDGYYQEPPAEMLPPMPMIQQTPSGTTDCCAIL